jgi:glycosyltransferase involved in cell wall biosynthesis
VLGVGCRIMNVIVNGLAALKPRTGVGHHLTQLVQHLREVALKDEFTLYPGERFSEIIRNANSKPSGPPTSGSSSWKAPLKNLAKSIAKPMSRWHFMAYTRRWKFDLYHEPNFVPYPSRLPTVITIHDLSVLKYPQWHPADRVKLHQAALAEAAKRASHIITVSESVRQEVCEHLNVDSGRVTSIYNGIGSDFFPRPAEHVQEVRHKLQLPAKFFLVVGTIEPRKNLAMLMRAFGQLSEELRRECPLVLAGPWGWRVDEERSLFAKITGVRQLGYVADEDLPLLYCGATALLYPSQYEGFGMPPTEMLACNGVVVCSDIPVLREVCGRSALYAPPKDEAAWTEQMRCLAEGKTLPDRVAFQKDQFSWWNNAEQTHRVYQQVLGL